MRTTMILVIVLFSSLFIACSNNSREENLASLVTLAQSDFKTSGTTDDAQSEVIPSDRKIIKNGEIEFETAHLSETEKMIKSAVSLYGAYVSNELTRMIDSCQTNIITIQIPASSFDAFLGAVSAKAGTLINKLISAEDVTEEYIDKEAAIRADKQLEARYFELLKSCKTIDEMLKMEAELLKVRKSIDQAQSRLNFINTRSAYSTLRIVYYEPHKIEAEISSQTYFDKFKSAFNNGWQFVKKLSIGLILIWPLIIFLGLGLFIFSKIKKYQIRKKLIL